MTVRSLEGKVPRIAASSWVSEAAYVVGDVEIGEGSTVWPGAVVRADFGSIRIGSGTHIEDNCVVHSGGDLSIGNNVYVGHAVVVHCTRVGNDCLLGNHATLLDGAEIGDFCVVAAGALILPHTRIPDRSFAAGVPATVRPASPSHIKMLRAQGRPGVGYSAMIPIYRDAGL
jgi:carbonic anhydrase/acetyltransferase-like protein (isoleucine patch superfamily)